MTNYFEVIPQKFLAIAINKLAMYFLLNFHFKLYIALLFYAVPGHYTTNNKPLCGACPPAELRSTPQTSTIPQYQYSHNIKR